MHEQNRNLPVKELNGHYPKSGLNASQPIDPNPIPTFAASRRTYQMATFFRVFMFNALGTWFTGLSFALKFLSSSLLCIVDLLGDSKLKVYLGQMQGDFFSSSTTSMAGDLQENAVNLDDLPVATWFGIKLRQWKGFWLVEPQIEAAMEMGSHFKPQESDIILASIPKTGTTWLKALVFTIIHGRLQQPDPLLTCSPHELVPFLEMEIYGPSPSRRLDDIPSPRILSTHLPYELLPDSIKRSKAKIIYVARNPHDAFVSSWHFMKERFQETKFSFEEAFDAFCNGVTIFGPFFDHVLGYWTARDRVFFITYEELQADPLNHVQRLAKFLGCELGIEEVKDVAWRCSHERLRNLGANKEREAFHWSGFRYDSFFRRGVVGDWKNHFTPVVARRLDQITSTKLHGTGLEAKFGTVWECCLCKNQDILDIMA